MKGKRIAGLVLALTLLAMLFAPALAETVKTEYSDGSLVVRSGPGSKYAAASWVKNGQSITVLERGTTWSIIKVDSTGKVGYIKTRYISGSSGSAGTSAGTASYDLGAVSTRYANSSVNLRKGAGTKYGVVASLKRGARLSITGSDGNWYKVTAGDKTGYISKNYVSLGVSGTTTANVNLRRGASTNYGVIKVLAKGTSATVLSVNGNWVKVRSGDDTGWLYGKYISY